MLAWYTNTKRDHRQQRRGSIARRPLQAMMQETSSEKWRIFASGGKNVAYFSIYFSAVYVQGPRINNGPMCSNIIIIPSIS